MLKCCRDCPVPTLQYRVGVQDLLLYPGVFPTDGRQVLEDQLGALRLPGPGLSTDDDALVLSGQGKGGKSSAHLAGFTD